MPTRTIDRQQLRLLLEHQQDELDTCRAYEYLASIATRSDESATFRELAEDERGHARVFQEITDEELSEQDGKQRRVALLQRFMGRNRFLKHLAEGEQESAVRYERLLGDFPELEAVKQDELRHFDLILALMD